MQKTRNGGQVAKVHETDLSCSSFDVPGSEKQLAVSNSVEEKVILEPNTVNLDESICEPGAADDAVIAEEKIQTETSILQSNDKVPEVISDQKREIPKKIKKNDKIKFTAANEFGQIENSKELSIDVLKKLMGSGKIVTMFFVSQQEM